MKHTNQIVIFFSLFACLSLLAGCNSQQPPTPTSALTVTATTVPSSTFTPTQTSLPTFTPTPKPMPGFMAGGKPFRFVGAFIPGWYWGYWSGDNDVALITEAKQAGITVLHVMAPDYEMPLGSFREKELVKLDHFVDTAGQNGIYVMLSFVHGFSITFGKDLPFYDPQGIAGLIHRPEYLSGFKTHMEKVVTRENTVNGKKYADDPTIMAWFVIEEIVSAPWNYPNGFPDVTISEVAEWLEENAAYLKSLDPNHLVGINTTTAISTFSDILNQRWEPIIEQPSLDFVEVEDAEARIILHPEWMYTIDEMYAVGKPVVTMLSYTGGDIDPAKYCTDYPWQAQTMGQVAGLYLKKGAAGLSVFSWRPTTIVAPEFDRCYSYDAVNTDMVGMFQSIASRLGEQNTPPVPLEFVTTNQ